MRKLRYKWVVDERDPVTGLWSQIFDGSQPEMNRFLARRRLGAGDRPLRQTRQRRVLKRRFVTKREEEAPRSPRLWRD